VVGQIVEATRIDPSGLFEYPCTAPIKKPITAFFKAMARCSMILMRWGLSLEKMDAYLFNAGCHYSPYKMLGAQVRTV